MRTCFESAALCLVLCASAAQAADELLFHGRDLQTSGKPTTLHFTKIDQPELYLGPGATAGLVIGFTSLGIFLLYTIVRIVLDEVQRHAKYKQEVLEDYKTLKNTYNCDDREIDRIKGEFQEYLKRGGKPAEDNADTDLIN